MVIFQLFLFSLNSQRGYQYYITNHSVFFKWTNTSKIRLPLFPVILLPFPLFLKKVTFSFHYNSYYFRLCCVYLSLKLSQGFLAMRFFLAVLVLHAAWHSLWLWQLVATLAVVHGLPLWLWQLVATLVVVRDLPSGGFSCEAWALALLGSAAQVPQLRLLSSTWGLPRSGI